MMTISERKILVALDTAPDGGMPWTDLRNVAGLSNRGTRTVMRRMEDNRLITRNEEIGMNWLITFKGYQTVRGRAAA